MGLLRRWPVLRLLARVYQTPISATLSDWLRPSGQRERSRDSLYFKRIRTSFRRSGAGVKGGS